MTTVAYKDGIVAADGRIVDGGAILSDEYVKIARLPDGSVVASCGEQTVAQPLVAWLRTECVTRRMTSEMLDEALAQEPEISPIVKFPSRLGTASPAAIPAALDPRPGLGEHASVILFDTTGEVHVYGWSGRYTVPKAAFYAFGSGAQIAYGAMEWGAGAEDAVRVAARRDIYTGGRITTLSVGPRDDLETSRG